MVQLRDALSWVILILARFSRRQSALIVFAISKALGVAKVEPSDFYQRIGYEAQDAICVSTKTVTATGVSEPDDLSHCTPASALANVDMTDDSKANLSIHFKTDAYSDYGLIGNTATRI